MADPFRVVRDFESALCTYTGAPFAVTTTSCTMALLLACAWNLRNVNPWLKACEKKVSENLPPEFPDFRLRYQVEIPKRTYVGVPMSIIHAGGRLVFRDEEWRGAYQLKPLPVWDSARWFTSFLWVELCARSPAFRPTHDLSAPPFHQGQFVCVSFHTSKILADTQGGAILHDSPEADAWLRRARFDGRAEGVAPKDDTFGMIGWHAYMSPDVAARLLWKLSALPRHNDPLPWGPGTASDYPDLSQLEIFR